MLATSLTIAEIVYVLVVSAWIVLQRRSPAVTLAWILLIIALPVGGLVAYYLVGHRRVRKNRLKRIRARLGLREAKERLRVGRIAPAGIPLDARALQISRLATRVSDMPPSSASAVRVLHDGDEAYAAIEAAIRGAKHHVHVEYYIFEPDQTGTRLRDLLVERALAGIEVRLLVDALGSHRLSERFLAPLRAAGARFAWFSPVRLFRLRPHYINFRTHRKIVIVDGQVGFTGGVNVTDDESAAALGERAFRDTHVELRGDAVQWLQVVFLEDFHHATGQAPTGPAYFEPAAGEGTIAVQIVSSGPDQDWEAIKKVYFAAITGARERVWVTTPYFVPDEPMLAALTGAALRGVDVRVLVPRKSDLRIVTAAARSYYEELLAAGVRIHEYLPRVLHAKTLVVDENFAAIGTANLDNRSFRLNYEVSAVILDAATNATLASAFADDLARSREVDAGGLARKSLGTRLFEGGARLLSPLL
jgi:cardiolipin synthase